MSHRQKENKPRAWKIVNTLSVTVLEMIDKNDVRRCKRLSHVCKSQTPPPHRDQYEEGTTGNKWNSEQRERGFSCRGDRYMYQWLWIAGRHQREGSVGRSLSRQKQAAEVQSPASRESVWEQQPCLLSSKMMLCMWALLHLMKCSRIGLFLYVPLQVEQWDIARASFVSCLILYLYQICGNIRSYCSLFVIEINTGE